MSDRRDKFAYSHRTFAPDGGLTYLSAAQTCVTPTQFPADDELEMGLVVRISAEWANGDDRTLKDER
jgi:hypothetical protein